MTAPCVAIEGREGLHSSPKQENHSGSVEAVEVLAAQSPAAPTLLLPCGGDAPEDMGMLSLCSGHKQVGMTMNPSFEQHLLMTSHI